MPITPRFVNFWFQTWLKCCLYWYCHNNWQELWCSVKTDSFLSGPVDKSSLVFSSHWASLYRSKCSCQQMSSPWFIICYCLLGRICLNFFLLCRLRWKTSSSDGFEGGKCALDSERKPWISWYPNWQQAQSCLWVIFLLKYGLLECTPSSWPLDGWPQGGGNQIRLRGGWPHRKVKPLQRGFNPSWCVKTQNLKRDCVSLSGHFPLGHQCCGSFIHMPTLKKHH